MIENNKNIRPVLKYLLAWLKLSIVSIGLKWLKLRMNNQGFNKKGFKINR